MKRFLSILMTLAMLVCMIPAVAFGAVAEETTAWDGTSYDVSWCDKSDSGVEIDGVKYQVTGYSAGKTYEISTAAQLAGLAKLVNAYKKDSFENVTIKLTADIDLGGKTWEMIGKNGTTWNNTYAFAGSFVGAKADGSNAVISNLNIKDGSTSQYTVGLFGLFRGPLMANLTLKNAVIESNYGRTGSFVGTANSTTTFRNLISDATIVMNPSAVYNWTLVGGIAGAVNNAESGNIFEKCAFTGSISCAAEKNGVQVYGGIVGTNEGVVRIKDCVVTGKINAAINGVSKSSDPFGVGGILGISRWSGGKVDVQIERCYVSSDMTGFQRVGGIIGALYTTTTATFSLKDCQFDGTVISNGGDVKTGMIGYTTVAGTIENCLMTGVASCRNGNDLKMGLTYGTPTVTFTNCYGTYKALLKTGATDTVSLLENGKLPEGYDATVWKVREGTYPILAVAESYANETFLNADLSWIDAANTGKTVWIDTEAKLLGAYRMFLTDSWVLGDRVLNEKTFNNMMNVKFSGAALEWLKKEPLKSDTAFNDIAGNYKMPMKIDDKATTGDNVKSIQYQTTAIKDGKYGVRLVAQIKGCEWETAEFGLVATYTDIEGNTKISALRKEEIKVCYSSLLETVNGNSTPATPDEGYYFIVLDIGEISADYTNISFDLYALVTGTNGSYYSATYAAAISAPTAE